MVGLTGVDFLFQDVDVVWFKDPLTPFLDAASPIHNYDAYFQVCLYGVQPRTLVLLLQGVTHTDYGYRCLGDERMMELVVYVTLRGRPTAVFTSFATILGHNTS